MTPRAAYAILMAALERMQKKLAATPEAEPYNAGLLREVARELAPHLAAEMENRDA